MCLKEKAKTLADGNKLRTNFITTYNCPLKMIREALGKHWHILLRDTFLKKMLPKNPGMTYRRPPTIKNILTDFWGQDNESGPVLTGSSASAGKRM